MKLRLIVAIPFYLITITAMAQTQYQAIDDSQHPGIKILIGIISKDIIKKDSTYKWYAENQKIYSQPDSSLVNAFKRNKDKVNFIVFGGTWCEDTQFILPKFFILQEQAGISEEKITLFGVDRQKKTWANLSAAFNILNVPTIIIMKDGKEIGRVVEYGKTGKWDKELAGILEQ